ncbi:transposase domain-containing protein [Streptomyces sp. NPDC046831]|uniref:transposase domain-containing protein n=1 Tax=Streptomyces sp. NPDC046831 TaxID=3154805 RepID=UPI0033C8067F
MSPPVGHLGELTQIATPHLVDEVLAVTPRVQKRVRKLPSRVVGHSCGRPGSQHNTGHRPKASGQQGRVPYARLAPGARRAISRDYEVRRSCTAAVSR